jgi:hypothetical protein
MVFKFDQWCGLIPNVMDHMGWGSSSPLLLSRVSKLLGIGQLLYAVHRVNRCNTVFCWQNAIIVYRCTSHSSNIKTLK